MYVRLILLIDLKNGLELMARYIGSSFYKASCSENIWSWCGAEFGPRCDLVVVLKQALFGLKTESNSFHKYFSDFLRDLGFTASIVDQDLCIRKSDNYEGYYYIATHVDDIIITNKNPSKYMRGIDIHFKVKDIKDSPNYYLGN